MGELIHVDFNKGCRTSPEQAEASLTFDRAVNLLATLGPDNPNAREAISFLTQEEQIEAIKQAEGLNPPEAS